MSSKPVSLGISRITGEPDPDLTESTPPEPASEKPAADVNLSPGEIEALRGKIVEMTKTIFDPEIPVSIYELGLIYNIAIAPGGAVDIDMTLTSPACPVAGALPAEVEQKVRTVPSVTSAKVELVWEPPWDKDRMSEAAKLQLGLDDW